MSETKTSKSHFQPSSVPPSDVGAVNSTQTAMPGNQNKFEVTEIADADGDVSYFCDGKKLNPGVPCPVAC